MLEPGCFLRERNGEKREKRQKERKRTKKNEGKGRGCWKSFLFRPKKDLSRMVCRGGESL